MVAALVLLSGCVVGEGEERIPSPTATSTQVVEEVSLADVQQDAEGRFFIPDQGDGCAYFETGRTGLDVGLWAEGCETGFDLTLSPTGEPLELHLLMP